MIVYVLACDYCGATDELGGPAAVALGWYRVDFSPVGGLGLTAIPPAQHVCPACVGERFTPPQSPPPLTVVT